MLNSNFVRIFIKKNSGQIFSTQDRTEQLKELRKRYFVNELNKKYGIPSESDIAMEAVFLLIKTKNPKTSNELAQEVANMPFLRRHVLDFGKFEAYLEQSSSGIVTREELAELEKEEYVKKKEQQLIEKIKPGIEKFKEDEMRKIAEEKKSVEEERQKLDALKKELESFRVGEEEISRDFDFFSEGSSEKTRKIWWSELGFLADPFPGENKGLMPTVESRFYDEAGATEIEKENFFDEVLITNNTFNDFKSKINANLLDFLNKTFIVLGGFGSGKSVLFEFVERESLKNNILVIQIWMDAKNDIDALFRDFYREILKSKWLRNNYRELMGSELGQRVVDYDKEEVCDIINEIRAIKPIKGVVFIIDGLHKNEDLSTSALKFVKSLQNFSDKLYSEEIKSAIFIAGSSNWIVNIKQDPALSGSISKNNIITLPSVEAHMAYEMFNKRFKAFSKDKEKFTRVPKENVISIQNRLKSRYSRSLTFRDYIDELMPSLRESNVKSVIVNPLYSQEIASKILTFMEENYPSLYSALQEIKQYFSKKPENALKLIKIFVGMGNFVSKDDQFFIENKTFMQLLHKFGLLKSEIRGEKTGLGASQEIYKFSSEIKKEFGHGFNEVIVELMRLRILGLDRESDSADKTPDEIKILDGILIQNPELKERLGPVFTQAAELHKKLLGKSDINKSILLESKESIRLLLEAIFCLLRVSTQGNSDFKRLNQRMLEPSFNWLFEHAKEYEPFSSKVYRLENNYDLDKREYYELFSEYKRAFLALSKLILDLIRTNQVFSINRQYLLRNDMGHLHDMRKKFMDANYGSATKLLCEYYEQKMRRNLYNILKIKYDDKYRSRLGSVVNSNIKLVEEKTKKSLIYRPENENYLYSCDRNDYSYIVLGEQGQVNNKKENWDQIFSSVFNNISKPQLETMFHNIHPFLTGQAHNWPKTTWEKNVDKLRLAMQNFADLCESLNRSYSIILDPKHVHEEEESVYFSFFDKLNDKDHLRPLRFQNNTELKKIGEKIDKALDKGYVVLNLEDAEEIQQKFSCQYRDFIGVLAIGIKRGEVEIEFSNGNYILKKVGGRDIVGREYDS